MTKNLTDEQDEQLMALIAQQQSTLRAVIRSMTPNPSDCADILQETNLVLWRKRDMYQFGTNFGAWAGTIARFQVMAWRKRRQKDRVLGFDDPLLERIATAAVERFGNLDERRDALQICLDDLPTKNRELIEHFYFRKAPLDDYAKRSGRTYAAVSKLLERLRTRLRDCINQRLSVGQQS